MVHISLHVSNTFAARLYVMGGARLEGSKQAWQEGFIGQKPQGGSLQPGRHWRTGAMDVCKTAPVPMEKERHALNCIIEDGVPVKDNIYPNITYEGTVRQSPIAVSPSCYQGVGPAQSRHNSTTTSDARDCKKLSRNSATPFS